MFLTPINLVRGIKRIIVVCIGNNSFKSIVSDFLFKSDFFCFIWEVLRIRPQVPFAPYLFVLIKKRFRPIKLKAKN